MRRRIPRIQIQIESACTRAEAGWGLIKGALLQRRRAYTGLVLQSFNTIKKTEISDHLEVLKRVSLRISAPS